MGGARSLYDAVERSVRKMPTLTNVVKDSIKNAIQAREPSRTKSGDYLLKFGNARNSGYRFLVKGGVATPAGEFWRDQTGQALPVEGFAVDQTVERRGRTDYIETTKGQQAVRSWDPVRNKFKYTSLGRKYYRNRRSEWVANIPVLISGKRLNGL